MTSSTVQPNDVESNDIDLETPIEEVPQYSSGLNYDPSSNPELDDIRLRLLRLLCHLQVLSKETPIPPQNAQNEPQIERPTDGSKQPSE